jgi:photosystem II stability/assembly factor-like uncharacterized protein
MTPTKAAACAAALLASALALDPVSAAPGKLTPTGPFGVMDLGVRDLVFPGTDPKRILIKTRNDVFESRDAGASWRSVLDNASQIEPAQLVVDPADPARWYAVESRYGARIWLSADAGLSWSGLPFPAEDPDDYREMHLFVDARDPQKMVLEVVSSQLAGTYRYLSQDRGASFSPLDLPGWPHDQLLLKGFDDGSVYTKYQRLDLATGQLASVYADTALGLFFDRTDRNTHYLFINETLYKSPDRGATRQSLGYFGAGPRVFVQSPKNPSHLAVASTQGFFLSLDRGASWVNYPTLAVRDAAFDPATGELLLASQDLVRRRLDGSFAPRSPLVGLDSSIIREVAALGDRALAVGFLGASYFRDGEGLWQRRGDIDDEASVYGRCDGEIHALFAADDPNLAVAVCETGTFTTTDAGWTWKSSPTGPLPGFFPFQLAASGRTLLYLGYTGVYRSPDFGVSWEQLAPTLFTGIALHASRGPLAVKGDGSLFRYQEGNGWQPTGAALPGNGATIHFAPYIVGEPAHPNLVYGIRGSLLSRSLDFGDSWEVVSDLDLPETYLGPFSWRNIYWPHLKVAVDPFDANHFLLLVLGLETRDGGRTFSRSEGVAYGIAAFDRLTPGRLLVANDAANGVLEQTASLPACTTSDQAWCARFGRYLLTVDWKDPLGNEGRATKVVTGSEDSGLFYFFDRNNWELLVKVLDGCGINQRHWLFAAGTTDVEYRLRVEDRWTGQIRHYFNPAGQAAAAITDTDAFAGCAVTSPPGGGMGTILPVPAPVGASALSLVQGRFEAKTRWTNFAGQQGDGLTAPLSSDNSGLFYFFSPDNWEMLVKVLNGCAINGHYWMLAAATTDVGYELTIRDTTGAKPTRTYRNPVGRASPAQIDLQAFGCN